MRSPHMTLVTALLAVALVTPAAVAADGAAPGKAGAQAEAKSAATAEGKAGTRGDGKSPGAPAEKSPQPPAAQDPPANPESSGEPAAQGSAAAQAEAAAAAEAQLAARKKLDDIKQRGARVPGEARAKAEAKLAVVATRTDEEVAAHGAAKVAGRLAAEFGTRAEQLRAEHRALGCSWGDLMIAHSLAANVSGAATVEQMIALRREGTGWGQIAAGLGLKLGHVVSAVQAEGRVATGLAKPDGKVAAIRGDGTRVDAGAGARAGAQTAVPAGGASAAAGAGVGIGVKIKP